MCLPFLFHALNQPKYMRIAVDASRLAVGQRTGTEAYTWEVLQALAHQERQEHWSLYLPALPAQLPALGTNWSLRIIKAPRVWTHLRFGPQLLLDAPDVAFIPAHVLPITAPQRSVVTIHDLGYEYYPEAHPFAQRLYLRWSTRWSARQATHLIAISKATQRDIVRWTGVAPAKISVVYHGVHPRFHPQPAHISREVALRYGLTGDYILFISTIQPRKNLVRLIDAYAQAARAVPDLPALALGGRSGWLTSQIEARAAEHGISERVRFLGYVHDADLPALLSGATIYVLPSLYEGFGMTVLEAMATGTPVITSQVASLPEVAGDAALLIDPHNTNALAEALSELWHTPALREQLQERGRVWAATWTWQRCAQQTLAVLKAVGNGHTGEEVACGLKT